MSEEQPRSATSPESPGAPGDSGPAAVAMGLLERWNRSRLGRALGRYMTGRGALLAGGIAYTGLFSVFAALAIGVSVLMATIGRNRAMRDATVSTIDSMLPGILDDGSGSGLVSIDQLTLDSALNLGSVAAVLALLYSAMSLMGALRSGVQAMFGIVYLPVNPVVNQLRNLAGFLLIMVSVLVTAIASVITGSVAAMIDILPPWLTGWGVWLLTLGVSFLIDAAALAAVVRVCGVRVPRRDLIAGSSLGAVAFGLVRRLGTGAVSSVADNPLLASFAAIIVLVLWLHLASRIVLVVCAWTANPPRPRPIDHPDEVHATMTPNYVTQSVPETLSWPRQDLSGTVDIDATAHPDYIPPVEVVADPWDDALPVKPGARAWVARRRAERAIRLARAARERYLGM